MSNPAHHELSANQAGASTAAATAMPLSYGTMVPSQHGYRSSCMAMPSPPAKPVGGSDQYTEFLALAAVDLANMGVRLEGSRSSLEMIAGYKRKRDERSASVLGATNMRGQQTIIVDNFLLNHASNLWEALAEKRQRFMSLIISASEDRAAKRLKVKDEEMKCILGINSSLQERLRDLNMDAQRWRDVARSNELVANVLRGDLQRVLDAQPVLFPPTGDVDDASSCCWGDYHVDFCGNDEHEVRKPVASIGSCKGCGQSEAVVLLLPCRHLCVCVPCAAMTRACLVCGCDKTDNINVNFS